jgi:Fe-S cluster assembly iron-binding protein IscA
MSIEVTPEAVEVLKRSLELAQLSPETNGVRLRGSRGLGGGFDVQVEMADGALEGEETIQCSGLNLFIDPQVRVAIPDAVVTVEPQHETIVVRPVEPA